MANQMGPGGPGGDSYDPNKNKPVVTYTSPGYTGSGSQSGNQGAGQSSSSAAPSDDEIKNTKSIKQKLKDSLEGIVASQGQPGFEKTGIAGKKIKGKNKDGQTVEIIIPSNVPEKFHQFLINNAGNQAGQAILNNYAASGVNPYQQQIQNFKNLPGGLAVFKEKFPNPLVKIGQGIGEFFKKGTLLGKFLSGLSKSDQNKLKTIQNEQGGVKIGPPAYDVNQYGLGGFYEDKILRDLKTANAIPGINTDVNQFQDEGIMAGAEPYDASNSLKRRIVSQYYGVNAGTMSQSTVDQAYAAMMNKIEKNKETNMMGASSPGASSSSDYSNFQDEIVNEVTEKNAPGPNEDNMMGSENIFDFDSSALLGSDVSDVSETEYKENTEALPNQFPIITNKNSPYADLMPSTYAEQMNSQSSLPNFNQSMTYQDLISGGYPTANELIYDVGGGNLDQSMSDIFDVAGGKSALKGASNDVEYFANGGYNYINGDTMNSQSLTASANIDDRIMKNLQYEKMAPGMMGYNAGGYAGMSTFDKLKMIADSGYQS